MDRRIKKQKTAWVAQPGESAHICQGLVPRAAMDRVVLVAVALPYSHASWFSFCLDNTALAEVLGRAWSLFGGAPRTWFFETGLPSSPHDQPVLNQARVHAAMVQPLMAADRVHWGEVALRSVPHRLLRRELLQNLGVANRALYGLVLDQQQRCHPQMLRRRVCEVLEQERRYLKPAGEL